MLSTGLSLFLLLHNGILQDACRSEVTQEKRQRLNYTAPVYLAAAFCVASVELKVMALLLQLQQQGIFVFLVLA